MAPSGRRRTARRGASGDRRAPACGRPAGAPSAAGSMPGVPSSSNCRLATSIPAIPASPTTPTATDVYTYRRSLRSPPQAGEPPAPNPASARRRRRRHEDRRRPRRSRRHAGARRTTADPRWRRRGDMGGGRAPDRRRHPHRGRGRRRSRDRVRRSRRPPRRHRQPHQHHGLATVSDRQASRRVDRARRPAGRRRTVHGARRAVVRRRPRRPVPARHGGVHGHRGRAGARRGAYDGRTGNAGHVGHVVVDPEGRPCTCGGRGCVETVASGPHLARWARDHGWEAPPDADAKELAEAAGRGDAVALQAFGGERLRWRRRSRRWRRYATSTWW